MSGSHRFGLDDLRIELVTDFPQLLDFWRRYTAMFQVDEGPGLRYEALIDPEPAFTDGDGVRRRAEHAEDLFPLLEGAFLADLVRRAGPRGSLIHAAALAQDGEATVFMGRSGAGKSTLCVELVRRGRVYLSDELVLLEGDRVVALPRPICLDERGTGGSPGPDGDDRFESSAYEFVDLRGQRRRVVHYLPQPPLVARAGERFALGDVVLLERGESGPPSRRVLDGAERRARLALSRFEGPR